MLYLYPKTTVDFTNNGDPIHHSYDEHVIRDDGFYLTFNLLLDKEEGYKKIKKEMIVSADTPDGINQFRIYDIKNKSTVVEVTAVQLMYDFDNKEVNPFSLKNSTGSQVIGRFKSSFKSTLGQFTMDSSVTETHDFATNNEDDDTPSHNALEVLNRITNRWDSELMLNGFDIRMIKRLGAKTDALLYEKKNISEFEDASSVSGMITRIHATSKFTPEGKEDEVILSVTVDSPLINEYAQIYEKSYVNNDCRTEAELIAWTKLKYSSENVDKPSRSITVSTNIIDGTEINYGDDLVLKYLVHDVDEIIRCVGYDYDPIKNTYYSVTLGDWKDSFLNTVTSNIIDNTNKQLNQMKNSVTYIAMSANGKNRNSYGPDPVPNPINGDQWYYYEFDRPNDVEFRVYQDGFWVKVDFFATKKEVEDVLDQADKDRIKAEQDFETAKQTAKEYTEAKAQEFDNQLLIVNQNVLTATNSASAAVLKADKAIEDAGFMRVDVDAAKVNAIDALTKAQSATDNVNRLSTSFDALTQTVGFKAEKAQVNAISGVIDQHTLDITANAQAINARLTSAQVDSLVTGKGYVNQAQLTATSSQWNLALTQVSTDLSNLSVGDRNLILNSGIKKPATTAYIFANYQLSENWVTGSEYTVVMKATYKTGKTIGSYHNAGSKPFATMQYDPVNQVYVGTAKVFETAPTKNIYFYQFPNDGMSIEVEWVKLIKGNKVSKDWTPAPEDLTTLEKTASLELRIDGFQTTIADKADKTQVTQLANQWTQTTTLVNGHTGQISNLGEQLNLRVTSGQVTEAILADKTIKDTRNDNQDPYWYITNYPRQEVREFKNRAVMGVPGNSTYIQVTTKVPWAGGTSGGVPVQVAESNDGTYQRVSSSTGGSWLAWDKVAETGKLIAQINLSTEGVLIQGKVIQLDGDVRMNDAFVTRLDALTLTAVYADIPTIRNKVFITDVVTANMIKADTGLFDKVFINDAVMQKLTAKASFINSVKAIDITADKVTGGTFNAALMNVVGLNANSMTTGTLNGANYSNNLNTGVETFRNPSNGSTLSIQQDKFYFNTSGASHYLIPDNEGLAFVPATGNTGNNRNAGIRLQSTNFNFVDLGYGSDGGFLHRVGSYPDTMAFINKDGGGFTFSHTGVLDVLNANTRRWDMTIGNYGQFKYGKSAIQFNGYDSYTIPKVKIVNPSTGALATLDVGYINLGNQPASVELSNVGTSFKIEHVAGRNWIFADGLNGTLTYGITRLALNGHNNASARLSVYGAGGTSYGYMSAANFDVQSERKYKDNIVDFNGALGIIATMQIHQYDKNGISEIGIITDEAPDQLLADNGTKVSLYDYASLAVKGVQELDRVVWGHEVRLSKHDQEIKDLKEKIKQLESVA